MDRSSGNRTRSNRRGNSSEVVVVETLLVASAVVWDAHTLSFLDTQTVNKQ